MIIAIIPYTYPEYFFVDIKVRKQNKVNAAVVCPEGKELFESWCNPYSLEISLKSELSKVGRMASVNIFLFNINVIKAVVA